MSDIQTKKAASPIRSQSFSEAATQSCESFEKCVGDNPGTAVLISSVVGMGLGVAIAVMLTHESHPEPTGWPAQRRNLR